MAILPLVIFPNPILKKKSEEVKLVTDEIKLFASDMLETMYHSDGIGLAAVQVGRLLRIIVVDVEYKKNRKTGQVTGTNPYIMLNPQVISNGSNNTPLEEGCLSFPEQSVSINRPAEILVKYTDLEGKECQIKADGLFAKCIQHEIDHTNGKTIEDYASFVKKNQIIKSLTRKKTHTS